MTITRRRVLSTGLAVVAGAAGLTEAARLASRYGLVPPDGGGIYGPGETLDYAAANTIGRHTLAREFPRRSEGHAAAKPDHRSRVRRGLVVHRRVDRNTAAGGAARGPPLPGARFAVYFSTQRGFWNSIDIAEALHPQTLLTVGMNDGDLPVGCACVSRANWAIRA